MRSEVVKAGMSFLIMFGCAGLWLLRGLSPAVVRGGHSLRWLPFLWNTGSRAQGLRSRGTQALERGLGRCGIWA